MSALEERTGDLPLMTEEEFERWCDEEVRAEYVDGKVIVEPTMTLTHYHANRFLLTLVDSYLEHRPAGRLLGLGYMVRLRAGLRRVPDLLYVAPEYEDRIRETILEGAPPRLPGKSSRPTASCGIGGRRRPSISKPGSTSTGSSTPM